MSDYAKLAAQLAMVRRAWKRRRMVAGLAVVLLESLALLTLFLLADWLYQPAPAVRVVLFAVAVAAFVALLVRHVLVHLVRKISDEQLALYVEEHRADFQGALMTAAEFGRGKDLTPRQARMIQTAMDAAINRASGLDLRRVVTLRRFRKYGWAAALLVVVYAGMCVVFPSSVGHHVSRVLAPWRMTAEDLAARGPAGQPFEEVRKAPIAFTLSKGDVRVPRGGAVDLEAALSRPPDEAVVLHFRPAVEGDDAPWRDLPMGEIDKLNGFAATLKDINEDLQFYVSSGEHRSDAHAITVYNPLALVGLEVRTKFPAYLKRPDRVEPTATGDVAAPIGSAVTVRLLTNNPLAGGRLTWEGAAPQDLEVADEKTVAAASFDVAKDGAYGFTLRDIDGQELTSTVPAYVRALVDQPPALEVRFPKIDVVTHPLGQVSVDARVSDDFGVEAAEFVYQLAAEGAREVRLPLTLSTAGAGEGATAGQLAAEVLFALEDVRPAVAPGEVFTYHLECRDQKGQVASSDLYMITITPFEQWATWGMEYPEYGAHGGYLSENLSVVLAAAWHLHAQKATLPEADFNRQADELAQTMVDPSTGEVFPFIKIKKVPPDKIEHGYRVIELAKKAHGALAAHDTAAAVEFLRLGVAELAIIGLSDSPLLLARGGGAMGGVEVKPESVLAQIAAFMMEADTATGAPLGQSNFQIVGPAYRRELLKIEEAEKLAQKAEELRRGEQGILERTLAMAEQPAPQPGEAQAGQPQGGEQPAGQPEAGANENPQGGQPEPGQQPAGQQGGEEPAGQPPPAPADAQGGGGGDSAAALAQDQRALAEQAKAAAMDARAAAATDAAFNQMADKMDQAARDMFGAAGKMAVGQAAEAVADVRRAQGNLLAAAESVQGLQQHSLTQAVDLAQAHAEQVLRGQREARGAAEALGQAMGGSEKPTAGQRRDLAQLAFRQGELRVDTEQLARELGNLRSLVEKGARPDTTTTVDAANRGIARHQVVQKMTNAAVELDAARPGSAAGEQQRAEAGLAAVLDSLRQAAGTLASDYKSELVRAGYEADRVAGALERLGGDSPTAPAAGQTPGETQPPTPPQGESPEAHQPGAAHTGSDAPGEHTPLTPGERRDLSQQAASELARLGRHLEARGFTPSEAEQIRRATDDADALAKVLESEEARREQLLGVVRKVGAKLMAELETKLEAERLKDFQREECPPQYRPLVNKYYEMLGQSTGP